MESRSGTLRGNVPTPKWMEIQKAHSNKNVDFQVRVHIIEARELQARDSNGMSDPVCFVRVCGEKKNTITQKKTTICTWDHLMFWELKMTPEEFFSGKIEIAVFDANTIKRDVEIGHYNLDTSFIYEQPSHEIYRKWVGLVDSSGKFSGVQGYVKISAVVLGPGDMAAAHNENEEVDENQGNEADLSTMLLLPPTIETKNYALDISIFRGDALPKLDQFGKCDGYVTISYGAMAEMKTEVKKGTYTPDWNEKITVPVTTPTMADNVRIQIKDWDAGAVADDMVGTMFIKFSDVMADKSWKNPRWLNIYGSPMITSAIDIKAGLHNKMNSGFIEGTMYRGRILFAADVIELPSKVFSNPKKERTSGGVEPPTENYLLRVDLFEGTEFNTKFDLTVEVSCGSYSKESKKSKMENANVSWYSSVDDISFGYPKDIEQVPDIFINVYKHKLMSKTRIAYLRIPAADINKDYSKPSWHLLKPDAFNHKSDGHIAGFLQFKAELIALGSNQAPVRKPLEKPKFKSYILKAHVYQGKDLLTGDKEGTSDPYCVVRCGKFSKKTKTIKETLFPIWYETLTLNLQLPEDLSIAPDVHITVFDYDAMDADDPLGRFKVAINDIKDKFNDQPTWYPIYLADPNKTHGEILASFQLFPEANMSQYPTVDITPKMRDCTLNIDVIGLRNMLPLNWFPITNPYVEFDTGSSANNRVKTKTSNNPSGTSPNYLQSLQVQLKVPENKVFAPPVNIRVLDDRKIHKPLVATRSVSLAGMIPWDKSNDGKQEVGDVVHEQVDTIPGAEDLPEEAPKEVPEPSPRNSVNDFVVDIVEEKDESQDLALIQQPSQEVMHEKNIKNAMYKAMSNKTAPAVEESFVKGFEHDEDKPKRETIKAELETILHDPPFNTYKLYRGKVAMNSVGSVEVGEFKGKFKLFEQKNREPPTDLVSLYKPCEYMVRIYVLEGFQLVPKDVEGNNPYIKIAVNGKTEVKDVDNKKQVTSRPQFFKCYELKCMFPFQTNIDVEVWDWDVGAFHDLIGGTKIELENRFYNKQWKDMKFKPIEYRTLWNPSSSNPQGQLSLWIDILTLDEAKLNPPENCAPPPPREYELRVIVWETRNVVMKDPGKVAESDIFVVCYPEGSKPQNTDTHWKSRNGEGLFNWRMKFPLILPTKVPTFKIQIWDQDLLNPNDAICEANLNLRSFFNKAFKSEAARTSIEKQWLPMTHPSFQGVQGEICASFELLTVKEAQAYPAGLGRKEPNMNPTLEEPKRPAHSLAPWQVDKKLGLAANFIKGKLFSGWKIKLAIACVCIILLLVVAFIIWFKFFF